MKKVPYIAAIVLLAWSASMAQDPAPKPAPSASAALRQPLPRGQALPLAKQVATDFLQGRGASLWELMTPAMQQALGNDRAKYEQTAAAVIQQIGHVTDTLQERMMPSLDLQIYSKLVRTDGFAGHLVISVALDPDGRIAGLGASPLPNPAPTEFTDYKGKTIFLFPLEGEWTIYQGGRSVYDNYHAEFRDQRFAYDITLVDNGSMYADGGAKLSDFYAFGKPVRAAGAGTVIYAQDRYDDNPIGKPLPASPKQGNSIIVDHGNGEFSFYAHLRHGSLKVQSGNVVKIGQAIAEVGNSGNSPIPHLHFHLQNTPTWNNGDGLPVFFHNVVVNGVRVSDSAPVRGDLVHAQ